jgi:hypothetical protein
MLYENSVHIMSSEIYSYMSSKFSNGGLVLLVPKLKTVAFFDTLISLDASVSNLHHCLCTYLPRSKIGISLDFGLCIFCGTKVILLRKLHEMYAGLEFSRRRLFDITAFWVVTPCSLVNIDQHFGRTCPYMFRVPSRIMLRTHRKVSREIL